MKTYKLKTQKEILITSGEDGSIAFVTRDKELVTEASNILGRKADGLLLKIFHFPIYTGIKEFRYGKMFNYNDNWYPLKSLYDSMRIQNYYAYYGYAPRIYGIFEVKNITTNTWHYALLTDDVGVAIFEPNKEVREKHNADFHKKLEELNIYGLALPINDQLSSANIINNKLVDWQGAGFKDDYEEVLKQRYAQGTMFGESKYQTLPELGIEDAIRKTDTRIHDLGLDKIDFNGKNVIDIGCSGGNFLMYASSHGAKRLTGIDWQKVIDLTMEASYYLGHFNIDYYSQNLALDEIHIPEVLELMPYDIAFVLSMTTHIKVPKYIHKLAKLMVLEINHPYQVDETLDALKPYWDIKYIGQSSDFGDRNIYHCFNKHLV